MGGGQLWVSSIDLLTRIPLLGAIETLADRRMRGGEGSGCVVLESLGRLLPVSLSMIVAMGTASSSVLASSAGSSAASVIVISCKVVEECAVDELVPGVVSLGKGRPIDLLFPK